MNLKAYIPEPHMITVCRRIDEYNFMELIWGRSRARSPMAKPDNKV